MGEATLDGIVRKLSEDVSFILFTDTGVLFR